MPRVFLAAFLMVCLRSFSLLCQTGSGAPVTEQTVVAAPNTPSSDQKPNYYLETGGFYSRFTPGGTSWRGFDARLIYSGWKKLTPFGGAAWQNASVGSQSTFGMGTYIHVNKWFYSIAGFSVAPNSATIFYPRARFDISGMFSLPRPKGFVVSTGFTEFRPYRTGGGGRVYSVGSIYYHPKAIFSGSVNFNEALPSGMRSVSAQLGVMLGVRGKYYLSAGFSGGKVAYELILNMPFDVRYNTMGTFGSLQKWVTKRAGFIIRYDYQQAFSNFSRHSLRLALFFEL